MKEATGELNMTVITVVAIAAVGGLFTLFVWPNIQANLMLNTACSNIDANGKYDKVKDSGSQANKNAGTISCKSYKCTAEYNGHKYTKDCNAGK